MFFCNVVSRWAQLVSCLCRMLNITDSDLQIQTYKNEVQLKLKLHQLWRIAWWLSKLQLSAFLKGSVSLLTVARTSSLGNSFRISLTVFWLFCNFHLARPWFRFSTRISSVAGLALYSVAFTRETSGVLFSWLQRYSRSFYWALTLTLIPASRIEIRVFLLASERNQIGSVHFDPLLLEVRGVVFFGKHFGKILALSFLEEFEDSSLRAQSFRILPLKTVVDMCVPS